MIKPIVIALALMLASCNGARQGMIVFTMVEGDLLTDTAKQQCHLAILDPSKPGKKIKLIADGVWSAKNPSVSPDCRHLAFAGKTNQDGPWQIMIMNLSNMKTTQVTELGNDCVSPTWLSNNKIAFISGGGNIYTTGIDGKNHQRITFDTYKYMYPAVLSDGRIIAFRSGNKDVNGSLFTALRPDGTKASLFFTNGKSFSISGCPYDQPDGNIYFTYSENGNHDNNDIAVINYRDPFNSYLNLTENIGGSFRSIYPGKNLIVSWRKTSDSKFSLREFDPVTKQFVRTLYEDTYFNAVEPVLITRRSSPRKLPSEVDNGVKTGLLMCQNINYMAPHDKNEISLARKAAKIGIMIADSLGMIDVEKDGSFYLKIDSDTPFRISTYDDHGNLINGPCSWLVLRPNERRGCVGCHTDPSIAPANQQPLAVRKQPFMVAAKKTELKEKEIELE